MTPTGDAHPDTRALAYEWASSCQGILVFIEPAVRTAAAAVAGAIANSGGIGVPRVYLLHSSREELALLFRELTPNGRPMR